MVYVERVINRGFLQWAGKGVRLAPAWARADALSVQQAPAIIADGSGGAFVAWNDKHNWPYTDIFLQHIDASGTPAWATLDGGLGVARAPFNQQNPALALDGSGGVIVVWQNSTGAFFDI